jgi:hypothetical protein
MKILKAALTAMTALLILVSVAVAAERKAGTIKGKLAQTDGTPLSDGLVFFFNQTSGAPPAPESYWRVPDEIAEIDQNGNFSTELLEGNYFVGAIQRPTGKDVGPPNPGDLFLVSREPTGKHRLYPVKPGTVQDIGTVAEAVPYKSALPKPGMTAIEGQVLGSDGKPVKGVFVFAFLTPAMVGRPLFVSEKTNNDGRFLLRLSEGGKYYLKVKELYGGGPPRKGSVIGGYGEDMPKAVEVKTGTMVRDIKISGSKFPGQGKSRDQSDSGLLPPPAKLQYKQP